MDDYTVVVNAGSSSLKFCIYRRPEAGEWRLESRGQIEGIGTSPRFSAKDGAGSRLADTSLDSAVVRDGRSALDALGDWLRSTYSSARVLGVGHRVVHGGPRFAAPTIVTPAGARRAADARSRSRRSISRTTSRRLTRSRNGCPACRRSPASTRAFIAASRPSPSSCRCRARSAPAGVQRYGFHGLSYEYIASVLPREAPEIADGRVIVAHLGSGASLCAMQNRKSVDSTLGFTALDGLCMGTRPGSLDPGVVLYLFQNLGLSAKEVETILYKKSGLLGISGISNDMRDLLGRSEPMACLAVDYFVYQAAKEIGALAAVARRARRARLHRRHRRELGRDPQANLRSVGLARHRARRGCESGAEHPNLPARQPRVGMGDSDQRGARHRAAHRSVAEPGSLIGLP